jgi:hypothetical protein
MPVTITKPQATLRELLAGLKKRTGLFGEQVMRTETVNDFYSVIGQNRNILINGDFQVMQRADYSSAQTAVNGAYQLDRWQGEYYGVSATIQQLSDGNHPNKSGNTYLRVAATSSGTGYIGVYQIIENKIFLGLRGQTVTLSLWVRSNNAKVQGMVYFGSDYKQVKIAGNGAWQYIKTTLRIPSTNTHTTPYVEVLLYDGGTVPIASGDYLEVADVQLEVGTAATPFERRSYGQELQLCQRYFQIDKAISNYNVFGTGTTYTGAYNEVYKQFSQEMRVAPTITFSAFSDFYLLGANEGVLTSIGAAYTNSKGTRIAMGKAGTANGQAVMLAGINTNATIYYSAEL